MDLTVLLNHLFLTVDEVTFHEISNSSFLHSEFAVSEARTTVRADYPDGYTALYFYGESTYFEFFDAGNSALSLGDFGIASGFEEPGAIERAKYELDKIQAGKLSSISRKVGDEYIPWFDALIGRFGPGNKGASIWAMQYDPRFIDQFMGSQSSLSGSILQKDVLEAYAIQLAQTQRRQQSLLKDISSVSAVMTAEDFESYSQELIAHGWHSSAVNDCKAFRAQNVTVSLCPETRERLPGVSSIAFSLRRSPSSTVEKVFGNSRLVFQDQQAVWLFGRPVTEGAE